VLHGGAQALLGAWLGLGSAGPAPTPSDGEPGVVLMAPDLPHDDADERLVATVRAAARDAPAALHVMRYDPEAFVPTTLVDVSQRRAGEHMASAVLWIDLRGPESYAVYLFEREGERVLGRRVPIVGGGTAAAQEIVANIAASVLAESLAGPVTGLAELDPRTLEAVEPEPPSDPPLAAPPEPLPASSRTTNPSSASASDSSTAPAALSEPAPPTAPTPSTDAATAPSGFPRMSVSLAYAGQSFARAPLLSHALALGVAWHPARGTFLGLRYDLVLPLVVDQPTVRFELRRHPISLEAGHRFRVASRWDVELAGRVTVDPIRRVTDVRSELEPTADRWRRFSAGAVGVGVGFAPISAIRVGLRVGAEALLTRSNYAVRDPALRVIVAPHPIRGFVELGVAFGWLWRPEQKK
jgi:hypothetical protein